MVSTATIPTTAGMVAALSGLYFGTLLENKAKKFKKKITDELLFIGLGDINEKKIKTSRRRTRIDLTPMLDVVFIMLIFFIVTTSFKEAGVDINRPTASTAEKKEKASILVAITETGEVA